MLVGETSRGSGRIAGIHPPAGEGPRDAPNGVKVSPRMKQKSTERERLYLRLLCQAAAVMGEYERDGRCLPPGLKDWRDNVQTILLSGEPLLPPR